MGAAKEKPIIEENASVKKEADPDDSKTAANEQAVDGKQGII